MGNDQVPQDSLESFRMGSDPGRVDYGDEGAGLGNLGAVYAALGDARRAIEFYERAKEIAIEIGDKRN
jgi:tetratricopeptide (TPR) repeat protein